MDKNFGNPITFICVDRQTHTQTDKNLLTGVSKTSLSAQPKGCRLAAKIYIQEKTKKWMMGRSISPDLLNLKKCQEIRSVFSRGMSRKKRKNEKSGSSGDGSQEGVFLIFEKKHPKNPQKTHKKKHLEKKKNTN